MMAWHNQPVAALFDVIRKKMPEDRPGALRSREYADLLAFIFELNGYPSGATKLDYKDDAMSRIRIVHD